VDVAPHETGVSMRRYILLGVDVALILFATLLAFALRENFEFDKGRMEALLFYLGATVTVAIALFGTAGLNRSIWRFSGMHDYLRVSCVVTIVCVGAVALSFAFNRLEGVARSLPFLQAIVGVMALVGARVVHRLRHSSRRRKASATLAIGAKSIEINILILGVTRLTEAYLQALDEMASGRINVAGIVGRVDRHVGRLVASHPVLGLPKDLESVLDSQDLHGVVIHRIVVAEPFSSLPEDVQRALLRVERSRRLSLQLLTDVLGFNDRAPSDGEEEFRTQFAAVSSVDEEIAPQELQSLSSGSFWKLKRWLDTIVALLALVALSPVFIAIALLVTASVGLPVVFWQRRPGLHGKAFHLYKFRTMGAAVSADGRRLSDCERASLVGNFLRRTRLDELPQLFNILWGDMSFVGPRPLLPRDQPKACITARLMVRPGLTGWAQVVGGRGISAEDKAALDVWYVCNANFLLDLEIAARTVPMVLFGERISQNLIDRARRELGESGIIQDKLLRI
jgi:lipopolysaccharide/colanic/teichoic acid biosynthesis glycosyltransferase